MKPLPEQTAPPLIEDGSALAVLAQQNATHGFGLLYHGSNDPLSNLEPRMPYLKINGVSYPDSDQPVVCTSPDPLVASFMGLRRRGNWVATKHLGEGRVGFFMHPSTLPLFIAARGIVAVLHGDESFVPGPAELPVQGWSNHPRLLEYRSPNPHRPQYNIRITGADFEAMLADRPDAELFLLEDRDELKSY